MTGRRAVLVAGVAAVWLTVCCTLVGLWWWQHRDRPTVGRHVAEQALEDLHPAALTLVCAGDLLSQRGTVWVLDWLGLGTIDYVTDADIRAALDSVC